MTIAEKRLKELTDDLERDARSLTIKLETFRDGFMKNPAYAFSWSKDLFLAAARLSLANGIGSRISEMKGRKNAPSAEQQLIWLADYAREEVTRRARSPEFSTSPTSNLMSTYELQALTEWLERIEKIVSNIRQIDAA